MSFTIDCVEKSSLRAQREELANRLLNMEPDAGVLWQELFPALNVPNGLAASSITISKNLSEKTISVEARWISQTYSIRWTFYWNRRYEIDPYTVETCVNGSLIRYKISNCCFSLPCCTYSLSVKRHNRRVRSIVRKCIPRRK